MKTNYENKKTFDLQGTKVNSQVSVNFALVEFVSSRMAEIHGIRNIPGKEDVENIIFLVETLLQPLRDLYGKPIRISSGFRSPELNRLVGGAPASHHLTGEAADCVTDDPAGLLAILRKSDLPFDQALFYRKHGFLHLSLRRKGPNRRQILYR